LRASPATSPGPRSSSTEVSCARSCEWCDLCCEPLEPEDQTMTVSSPSRRDLLKGAAAITAATAVGIGGATTRRAHAQTPSAAPDKGLFYEGAFGVRELAKGPDMTLDSVFRIASMTKAITSVAAMQLVEQSKLKLEEPVPNIDPALGSPQVLEGFDAAGTPRLRPAKRPITLRHLLTHTAGFSYEIWDANMVRYVKASGMP